MGAGGAVVTCFSGRAIRVEQQLLASWRRLEEERIVHGRQAQFRGHKHLPVRAICLESQFVGEYVRTFLGYLLYMCQ